MEDKIGEDHVLSKIGCDKLDEFMKAQISVIEKHIGAHKWFQHIPDKEAGVKDFIEKYGWLIREMYCGYACPNKDKCCSYSKTEKDNGKPWRYSQEDGLV